LPFLSGCLYKQAHTSVSVSFSLFSMHAPLGTSTYYEMHRGKACIASPIFVSGGFMGLHSDSTNAVMQHLAWSIGGKSPTQKKSLYCVSRRDNYLCVTSNSSLVDVDEHLFGCLLLRLHPFHFSLTVCLDLFILEDLDLIK
jgi:hypothetical protein